MSLNEKNFPKTVYDGKGFYGNQDLPEMICECGCNKVIKKGELYIRDGGGTSLKTFMCVLTYYEGCK